MQHVTRSWLYPVTVWLGLLSLIFVAEYGVMLLLPRLLPQHSSRLLESAVDAVVLTLLVAPALWFSLVRPLRELIRLRTQFLVDLFAQMENDRRQTATELHDGVGQALTLLISGLRSAKACRVNAECTTRVNGFQRLAGDALAEVRRLAQSLRPSLLDDLGLAPALERLADDVRTHHPIHLDLDVAGAMDPPLPEPVASAVFRIIQEALTNIIKHSGARNAGVAVRQGEGTVVVEVSDDGRGIAPDQLRSPPAGHLGLRGMRERADLLGGTFTIRSTPGQGTSVAVSMPLKGTQRG